MAVKVIRGFESHPRRSELRNRLVKPYPTLSQLATQSLSPQKTHRSGSPAHPRSSCTVPAPLYDIHPARDRTVEAFSGRNDHDRGVWPFTERGCRHQSESMEGATGGASSHAYRQRQQFTAPSERPSPRPAEHQPTRGENNAPHSAAGPIYGEPDTGSNSAARNPVCLLPSTSRAGLIRNREVKLKALSGHLVKESGGLGDRDGGIRDRREI
jgi:hypothetical protein